MLVLVLSPLIKSKERNEGWGGAQTEKMLGSGQGLGAVSVRARSSLGV